MVQEGQGGCHWSVSAAPAHAAAAACAVQTKVNNYVTTLDFFL